ncbi:Rha family transcriptional regulator [Aeromonas enteropelogenes]|uniref:Rha family transcriptional regulator n=1 Tax=Aeromonas enteropelogenes TaxID=29489 RepID=A0ABU9J6E6_AEREN
MTYSHTRDLSAVRPCRYSCISTKFIPPVKGDVFSTEQVELFQKLVNARKGEVFTTSRKVAKLFGKLHKDVLKAINNLECSPSFKERNFSLCFENSKLQNGKPLKYYDITKDGLFFLVMGFTGKQAAQLKELYIWAFNWMAEQLYESRKLQRLLHDFTRREAISVSKGSFHGQGLARRRIEKRALSQEQAQLQARSQLTLDLVEEGETWN